MSTRDKLRQLRDARENKGIRLKQHNFEDDVDIYDEVDEDGYKSVVKNRMDRPDFIEDDDGSGYIDNGMEDDWNNNDYDEVNDDNVKSKSNKSNKKIKQKESLGSFFARSQSNPRPKTNDNSTSSINAYRKVISEDKADDFLQGLLSNLDNDSKSTPNTAFKPPPRREPYPKFTQHRSQHNNDLSSQSNLSSNLSSDQPYSSDLDGYSTGRTGQLRRKFVDHASISSPTKKVKTNNDIPIPSSEDDEFDNEFDDDFNKFLPSDNFKIEENVDMNVDNDKSLSIGNKENEDEDIKPKAEPPKAWMQVLENIAPSPPLSPKAEPEFIREGSPSDSPLYDDEGNVRFYWIDSMEENGKVILFGKTFDNDQKKWQSTSVTVEGIQRNLFILPNSERLDENNNIKDEDKIEIFNELEKIRKNAKIKSFNIKFVKRQYAFEEKSVPRDESEWVKIVYGFDQPALPYGIKGKTFSHAFGTTTSAFELFVIKRKIMGPCWLKLEDAYVNQNGITWCKHQFRVEDPKTISLFSDSDTDAPKEPPPMTIMSLSTRSIVNHQLNCRELVCATSRVWTDVNIEDPTPPDRQPSSSLTLVRPLQGIYPPGFEFKARDQRPKIEPMRNEKAVLSNILALVQRHDPDVLIGHNLLEESIEILLNRMNEMKIPNWSKMGRVRRDKWPRAKFGRNKNITTGRLICDLSSDAAKGMISSTTWSMTEMVNTHLGIQREDIDPEDTANYFDPYATSPERLIKFVKHCEVDAVFNMALAAKVQILPLTRQLTTLAGNSWGRTLTGGRSERNEFILLHEFHRQKTICPDKLSKFDKKQAQAEIAAEQGEDEPNSKGKKGGRKDKFKGGLVFEPKKGLWDKYILVMDFNSLYPSIIQEYNIDFTTVERPEDDENGEERIPDVPSPSSQQGVLPRLIAALVNRRRQVKNLMKDKDATPAKLMQLDIRQTALKLTANSMYGCLGFEGSRFYARPLAALTTFKGREILTHTRELAESMQLDVVYGDTDSVFINSNAISYDEALKVANEFKKHVNERYKLLEIDLDGVFKRLLLLQKKKYAAIKIEEGKESTEIKGLDMKRREYSQLSKNMSQYVLDQILSGESTEVVVEIIHDYLSQMGESIRHGKVSLDDFIIFKRLGKDPEAYPDAKSQPHVQVAMRLKSKGLSSRSGDVVPYIFCQSPDGTSSKTGKAENAYHPDDLRRKDSNLSVDYEYYVTSQVLPPIERLCDSIDGTDRSRLAECLGLDPAKFQSHSSGSAQEKDFQTLESQMSDKERFRNAEKFHINCVQCKNIMQFDSIIDGNKCIQTRGIVCLSCGNTINPASVAIQLENQLRQYIHRFYEGNLICNDQSCGNKTRMMGVYGKRCLMSNCLGMMKFEYDDQMLYNQLLYFARLFDVERILSQAKNSNTFEEIQVICERNKALLNLLHSVVQKFLKSNARSVVVLHDLFAFMKF